MNDNRLVLIDSFFGFALLPIGLLLKFVKTRLQNLSKKEPKGILLIKFLGAGNLISIQDFINSNDCDLLTAKSNTLAINFFNIGKRKFYINESNFFTLIISATTQIIKLLKSNYLQVINLETESNFAKFLAAICSAKTTLGISNTNKSYIDFILYDHYFVNPAISSKFEILKQLVHFQPATNYPLKDSLSAHRENFLKTYKHTTFRKVSISPSCSNTDHLRRLEISKWELIIQYMINSYFTNEFVAIFPSQEDCQFLEFQELTVRYPQIKVRVTCYRDFVKAIKDSDLLITVDSQALHVAQHFKKSTICIYGPTSPFGVSISETTYPISRALECSPCTHKYLKVPCEGRATCMQFDREELQFFKD